MDKIRLHKAIADAGIASRRAAEKMIAEGKVVVNDQTVTTMGFMVDPRSDSITIDGVPLKGPGKKRTYLVYKPKNVICTRHDPQGRRTVFDLLPEDLREGLHSAGRLDYDAEGLIILTNDGALTLHLTHPKNHVPKTYLVKLKGKISPQSIKSLKTGLDLDDGKTLPARVSIIKSEGSRKNSWIRITLREGRKNQIKRMAAAVGHPVLRIMRIAIGPIEVTGRMRPGTFRKLAPPEIRNLYI
ncbi:MAG: rRNA pseudouridine synthase [Deltaproteobacteria bacterium]|nr:rRNA pseudouridine synthase [Deltaproteobacteria bacterium]